jgi:succinyl-diaminopimelate desuccinylase
MPPAIHQSSKTLTDVLSRLIGFPTITSNHATNRAALDWVQERLVGLPLIMRRYEHNGYPSLIATTKNAKTPKLWLVAHIDVVTSAPAGFKAKVSNGRLHGRGAHDMKFALASFIVLLEELGQDLVNYDLGLMVTSDEEVGGFDGVKWLINSQGYSSNAALIPDSGGSWQMEAGAKGIMWWELEATGKSTHASRTWDGVNAIDEVTKFVESVRSNVPAEPCGDPLHQHSTVNLSSLVSGGATNQVPGSATARLDIRYTPDLTAETISSWIQESEAQVPTVKAKVLLEDHPYQIRNEGPVTVYQDIVRQVTGHGVTFSTAHGSSDARHFAQVGIATINVCPTGSGFHVPDEWVDISDLENFHEINRRFVGSWARSTDKL